MKYRAVFKSLNNPEIGFSYDGYFDNSIVDLQTFKYTYSDFEARFKTNDLFKFGNATGNYLLLKDLQYADNLIQLNDDSIPFGTLLHVDDEILKINDNSSNGNYICERALFGTRRTSHTFNPNYSEGIVVFTGGRWSPIGLELDIFDEQGKLVRKAYVSELYSVGAGVLIKFKDILKKLENNVWVKNDNASRKLDWLFNTYNLLGVKEFFIFELSDYIKDSYLKLDDEDSGYFNINLKDVLNSALSASMSWLSYNEGVYTTRKILPLSVFNSAQVTKLHGNILYSGNYLSRFRINMSGCILTFSYLVKQQQQQQPFVDPLAGSTNDSTSNIKEYRESIVKSEGATTGGAVAGSMAEIDATAIIFHSEPLECLKIARIITKEYTESFASVVGEIDIDTLRYRSSGGRVFEPNKYYKSDELDTSLFNLFTIDTNVIMYCLGITGNTASFILLDTGAYKPVGVAMMMSAQVVGGDKLYLNENETARTFMKARESDLDIATHFLYDYLFMSVKKLKVFTFDNVLIGSYTVLSVGANYVELDGYNAPDLKEVVVMYADNTIGDINQEHLHLNVAGETI